MRGVWTMPVYARFFRLIGCGFISPTVSDRSTLSGIVNGEATIERSSSLLLARVNVSSSRRDLSDADSEPAASRFFRVFHSSNSRSVRTSKRLSTPNISFSVVVTDSPIGESTG